MRAGDTDAGAVEALAQLDGHVLHNLLRHPIFGVRQPIARNMVALGPLHPPHLDHLGAREGGFSGGDDDPRLALHFRTLGPEPANELDRLAQLVVDDGTSVEGMIVDTVNKVLISDPTPPYVPPPDLATQLLAALVNNGTITPDAIDDATLTKVNAVLMASGAISTAMEKSGGTTAKMAAPATSD